MKTISILDTTLRDGEQTPGISFDAKEKLKLSQNLEKLGVDVIEAGFPASSDGDRRAVELIAKNITRSKVSALCRASKEDIDIAFSAIKDAVFPRLHIFIATSPLHMEKKLKKTPEEVLTLAYDAIKYAKTLVSDIEFSCEDASRSERGFLYEIIKKALDAGATVINIPDTVGYSTPESFGALIKDIGENVEGIENAVISVHCHNDLGLAVANSLCAIQNGAKQVECTINGLGERAGNAALEEIVMALETRADVYRVKHNINTRLLTPTSRAVCALTGIPVQPNKAIVGANAFCHQSGIHQHGVIADRATYEIMTPESVGLDSDTILLGKLSGRHAFEEKLVRLGYSVEKEVLDRAFEKFKEVADKKNELSNDDIIALIQETLDEYYADGAYSLVEFIIQSGSRTKASAMVTLCSDKGTFSEAAIGEGPIDAGFNAINRITGLCAKLEKYNINAVTEGTDALGEVLVKISVDGDKYVGRGVAADIIGASLKAYVNAVNRASHGIK